MALLTKDDLLELKELLLEQLLNLYEEEETNPIMLNFIQWDKNVYEITLEKASFFFLRKMPIAFRPISHQKTIWVKSMAETDDIKKFINDISFSGKVNYLDIKKFKKALLKAYKEALFNGVRRLTSERLGIEEKQEEIKDVTDQKNNAGVFAYQYARHERNRP